MLFSVQLMVCTRFWSSVHLMVFVLKAGTSVRKEVKKQWTNCWGARSCGRVGGGDSSAEEEAVGRRPRSVSSKAARQGAPWLKMQSMVRAPS